VHDAVSQLPPPPPDGYSLVTPPPRRDGQAVAALVCGVAGFLCVLPAIVAIVLGFTAKRRIDTSNGALTGRGMAIAGIVLGIVWIVLTALLFLSGVGDTDLS
jgi:hypothetical protein